MKFTGCITKIIVIYGNSSMAVKIYNHNLVHRPRKITENIKLFDDLSEDIDFQLCYIESSCTSN